MTAATEDITATGNKLVATIQCTGNVQGVAYSSRDGTRDHSGTAGTITHMCVFSDTSGASIIAASDYDNGALLYVTAGGRLRRRVSCLGAQAVILNSDGWEAGDPLGQVKVGRMGTAVMAPSSL